MTTPNPPRRKSWFSRHWVLALSASLTLAACLVGLLFYLLRNSEVANIAFEKAQASPVLTERLGQPLQKGWLVSGSIEVTPASGHAELAIPVSGPKSKGTLYVEAQKSAGLWQLKLLQFGGDNSSDRLDLLPRVENAPPEAH